MPETPRMNYFSLMNICTCTIYRLNYKQQTQIELCSKITDTHMKSMSQAKVLTLTVHYYKTQTLIDVFFLFVLLTKSLTHSLTHSIPRLWGRRGGPEDRSRRPPQCCSFGDRQQEVWESHLRLVLDVVRPALSLSPTSASSLNGVLHDVFGEGVVPRDVAKQIHQTKSMHMYYNNKPHCPTTLKSIHHKRTKLWNEMSICNYLINANHIHCWPQRLLYMCTGKQRIHAVGRCT